ncbi:MAG: hypothetical protein IT455_01540 [Planctomycetes bacterium]|nr:hypothetical protein [Planctomycetota bacterium]
MSPIGRVFIVLNLGLAVGFLMVSGTHLQTSNNFKIRLEAEQAGRKADQEKAAQTIVGLEKDRNNFENAKTANETALGEARNQIARLMDDNKRLEGLTSSQEADLKTMASSLTAYQTDSKAAFEKAEAAYKMAIADQKVKDEAVNAKNASDAENRTLRTTIASLEETIKGRELDIAGLTKDKNELTLLVQVAKAKGFMEAMAVPQLAGVVTNASGKLCTIQLSDNPGNVDVQEHVNKGGLSFAIYDGKTYKGEAVATRFEASANALLCNVRLVNGVIREGDKAATQTN